MNRLEIIREIKDMKKQLNQYKKVTVQTKNKEIREKYFQIIQKVEKKIAFYVNLVGDVDIYDNENFKRKRDYK